jgi:hypothetical protein
MRERAQGNGATMRTMVGPSPVILWSLIAGPGPSNSPFLPSSVPRQVYLGLNSQPATVWSACMTKKSPCVP